MSLLGRRQQHPQIATTAKMNAAIPTQTPMTTGVLTLFDFAAEV
jgi:hypothetical protein